MSFLGCAESLAAQSLSREGQNIFPQDLTQECGFGRGNPDFCWKLTPTFPAACPLRGSQGGPVCRRDACHGGRAHPDAEFSPQRLGADELLAGPILSEVKKIECEILS